MERKKVSVVVPCLNHLEYTKETLDALEDNTPTDKYDLELVIVDDGSDDETPDYFSVESSRGRFENFLYLRNENNLGFAPAVNRGILESNHHADYISIFNNDVLVGPDWLTPLCEVLDWKEEIGMVNCTIHHTKNDFLAAGENIDPIDTRVHIWEKNGPWVFKKEVFDDIGIFDEQFTPAYYEDDDIMVRMCLTGWVFGRVENSISYHYLGITRNGELLKRNGEGYYNDNFLRFCKKWGLRDDSRFAIVYDQTFQEKKIKYVQIPTSLLNDRLGVVEISLEGKETLEADGHSPGFKTIKKSSVLRGGGLLSQQSSGGA